jgi:hypothetical protein
LAHAYGGDFAADFGDFSGDVATRNVGKRDGDVGQAATDPEVEVIQGAGAHADEYLVGAGPRVRRVGELQNPGPAVLVEEDRFHQKRIAFTGLSGPARGE